MEEKIDMFISEPHDFDEYCLAIDAMIKKAENIPLEVSLFHNIFYIQRTYLSDKIMFQYFSWSTCFH